MHDHAQRPAGTHRDGRLHVELALDQALADVDAYLAAPNKIREVPEAVAHWRRGLILEKLGRQDDALVALRQAQTLRPDDKRIAEDVDRLD